MAQTVFFNLITRPYSSTNHIKVALYKATDPLAEYASQTLPGPLGEQIWNFPGLDRVNYIVKVLEVDGTGTTLSQLDSFTIVPDNKQYKFKDAFTIIVDTTPGVVSGTSSFTFDGTGGTDDWRGWVPHFERIGQGTLKENVDYTWDKVTGTFTLINAGDTFQNGEYFFTTFDVLVSDYSGGIPVIGGELFKTRITVENTYSVLAEDFGKMMLLRGSTNYFEVTLPDIDTVVENRLLFIESTRGSHKAVKIISSDTGAIDWLEGARTSFVIKPNETIAIYKEKFDNVTSYWRIFNPQGNWFRVGEMISEDSSSSMVFNKLELNGQVVNNKDEARLYNDHILKLPGSQVVDYASWSSGNNKYKFSYADGSGNFHVPDLRNIFERVTDGVRLPGDYQADMVGPHQHKLNVAPNGNSGGGLVYTRGGTSIGDISTLNNTGTETRPINRAVKKYILT